MRSWGARATKPNGRSWRRWPRKKREGSTSSNSPAGHPPRPAAGDPSRLLTTMMDPGLRLAGMTTRVFACVLSIAFPLLAETISSSTPVVVATPIPVQTSTSAWATVVHPWEGAKLPPIKEVFVYGAVAPGSTLTINGSTVPVHPKGGYLAMVPLVPGNILLNLDAKTRKGETAHLERRFSVAPGFIQSPLM